MMITILFSYRFHESFRLLAITLLLCGFSLPGISFQAPKQDTVQPFRDNAPAQSLQIPDSSIINKDTLSRMVEAEYPGGRNGWLRFLAKNFRYPEEAAAKNIQGQVMVKFLVDEKGKLKDLVVVTGPKELTKEAVRVIKESRRWKPAQLNGEPVKSEKTQMITFKREIPGGNAIEELNRAFTRRDSTIVRELDVEASFPGGPSGWLRFLNLNFHYPADAQSLRLQGTVNVQFQVSDNGSVSEVEAISGPTQGGLREEVIRLIKLSGKWVPAMKNGVPVKSYKIQPLSFKL